MRPTSQYIASLPEAEHSLSPSQLKQGVAQVLYQNVDAIRALLYESAPILDSWAKAQVKAQQLTNPKGAGRKPANPVLMFLILLVRSFLGLSNREWAAVFHELRSPLNNIFLRGVYLTWYNDTRTACVSKFYHG